MLKLNVPTIFSAVDKLSPLMNKIGTGFGTIAQKAERLSARSSRWFDKFTPTLSQASKQLLDFASTAAIAGSIVAGVTFSGKSILDYEKKLASFKTIVSDLSDKDFVKFRSQIKLVAADTNNAASSIDIASSFETIAGLNAKFAETAEGLGQVSKAAIILSKASGDDLPTAAENAVGIMNQFEFAANQANRTINVLAAGQAVGAANISQTSQALKVFGSVAKGANVTLEQSVGLIETLAQKQIMGSEAGTALRGAITKLQKAGFGYKSGIFDINSALDQARGKFDKLRTAKEKDAFVLKTFGLENLTAAKILLDNIKTYKDFTAGVTGTSEAQKAAAINQDTLSNKLEVLKNKWVTYISTTDNATAGLANLKSITDFVINNMETIISVGAGILTFFGIWKGLILATQIYLAGYNIALGVMGGLTGVANIAIGQSTIALNAYKIASGVATAVTWLWNTALAANPLVWIIAGIFALAAVIYYWSDITKWFTKIWGKFTGFLTKTWDTFTKWFTSFDWKAIFMKIGGYLLDFFLLPLKAVLKLASALPGVIGKAAASGLEGINNFTTKLELDAQDAQPKPVLGTPAQAQAQALFAGGGLNHNMNINLNDPGNAVKDTSVSGPFKIPVTVTNTQGQK